MEKGEKKLTFSRWKYPTALYYSVKGTTGNQCCLIFLIIHEEGGIVFLIYKRKAAQDIKVKELLQGVSFKTIQWGETAFQSGCKTIWLESAFEQTSLIFFFSPHCCRKSAVILWEYLSKCVSLAFRQWFRLGSMFSTSGEKGAYISPLHFSVPFTAPSHEAIIAPASGSTWVGFMDGSRKLEL